VQDEGPRQARTPRQRLEEADRLFNWSTEREIIDQAITEMNDAESLLGYHPEDRR